MEKNKAVFGKESQKTKWVLHHAESMAESGAWDANRNSTFTLRADRLVFDSQRALVYHHIDICWT